MAQVSFDPLKKAIDLYWRNGQTFPRLARDLHLPHVEPAEEVKEDGQPSPRRPWWPVERT